MCSAAAAAAAAAVMQHTMPLRSSNKQVQTEGLLLTCRP
jgi:hypothetical protein